MESTEREKLREFARGVMVSSNAIESIVALLESYGSSQFSAGRAEAIEEGARACEEVWVEDYISEPGYRIRSRFAQAVRQLAREQTGPGQTEHEWRGRSAGHHPEQATPDRTPLPDVSPAATHQCASDVGEGGLCGGTPTSRDREQAEALRNALAGLSYASPQYLKEIHAALARARAEGELHGWNQGVGEAYNALYEVTSLSEAKKAILRMCRPVPPATPSEPPKRAEAAGWTKDARQLELGRWYWAKYQDAPGKPEPFYLEVNAHRDMGLEFWPVPIAPPASAEVQSAAVGKMLDETRESGRREAFAEASDMADRHGAGRLADDLARLDAARRRWAEGG